MKKLIALMIAITLIAGCSPSTPEQPTQGSSAQAQTKDNEDVPDCDFDDLLEGDEDCYGVDLEKKKTSVKKTVPAIVKPKATAKPKKKFTIKKSTKKRR